MRSLGRLRNSLGAQPGRAGNSLGRAMAWVTADGQSRARSDSAQPVPTAPSQCSVTMVTL